MLGFVYSRTQELWLLLGWYTHRGPQTVPTRGFHITGPQNHKESSILGGGQGIT